MHICWHTLTQCAGFCQPLSNLLPHVQELEGELAVTRKSLEQAQAETRTQGQVRKNMRLWAGEGEGAKRSWRLVSLVTACTRECIGGRVGNTQTEICRVPRDWSWSWVCCHVDLGSLGSPCLHVDLGSLVVLVTSIHRMSKHVVWFINPAFPLFSHSSHPATYSPPFPQLPPSPLPKVVRVKEGDIASLNKALEASNAALEATRQELNAAQALLKVGHTARPGWICACLQNFLLVSLALALYHLCSHPC